MNAERVPEEPEPQFEMTMLQARMLDLRTYICLLFLIFGVIVTILGISPSQPELDRAAGVNINLFAGIAMLILSIAMGLWAWFIPPIPTGRNLPND